MWKVVLLILIINVLGCTKQQSAAKKDDITFKVDQTLLAEKHICSALGISFQPPLNWESISPDMLETIKNNIIASQDSAQINLIPITIFMNMEKSFTCFLSVLESELLLEDVQDNYLAEFRSIHQDLDLQEGSFSHNGLDFHQITFVKDDFISIKLISANNDQKTFMVEYLVPAKYYQEELHPIESSIGTIKKLK